MTKTKKFSTLIIVLVAIFQVNGSASAQEGQTVQETPCTQNAYSSFTQIPSGVYDVYIEPGELKDPQIQLYYQDISDSSSCKSLLQTANQVGIFRAGELRIDAAGLSGAFIMPTSANIDFGSPNAPRVTLKAQASICDPLTGCGVSYNGQNFTLSPRAISLRSDSLKIGVLESFETQAVEEVTYSVDNRPVYRTQELEDFNLKFIPPGEHSIQRTVVLSNRLVLQDQATIKRSYAPQNFVTSYFYQYQDSIRIVGVLLLLIATWFVSVFIFRIAHKHMIWKRTHIASIESRVQDKQSVIAADARRDVVVPLRRASLVLITLVVLFFVINSWIFSVFTVDGLSMYPTLQDKQAKAISKAPITWSKLNRRDYIPERGAIIVFNHTEENFFDPNFKPELRFMVKRVIGLPGERVVLQNGLLTIFNDEFPAGFNPDRNVPWSDKIKPTPDKVFDLELGAGELFVAGDNRPESIDSRFYGPIKAEDVVGVVQ